jgi:hypothetical protein
MPGAQRTAEIIELLQRIALGEIDLSHGRVMVALKLLDLGISDAGPPDDGAEVLMSADLAFPRKFSA